MQQVDIHLIHKACKEYLEDPILKPFEQIDLTPPHKPFEI